MDFLYRNDIENLLDELNELMADLEDTLEDAQACFEETADDAAREDAARLEAALRLLHGAADLMETDSPLAE